MKKILTTIIVLCVLLYLAARSVPPAKNDTELTVNPATTSPMPLGTESNPEQTKESPTLETEKPSSSYEITFSSVKTYKNSIGTILGQIIIEIENTGKSDLYLGKRR